LRNGDHTLFFSFFPLSFPPTGSPLPVDSCPPLTKIETNGNGAKHRCAATFPPLFFFFLLLPPLLSLQLTPGKECRPPKGEGMEGRVNILSFFPFFPPSPSPFPPSPFGIGPAFLSLCERQTALSPIPIFSFFSLSPWPSRFLKRLADLFGKVEIGLNLGLSFFPSLFFLFPLGLSVSSPLEEPFFKEDRVCRVFLRPAMPPFCFFCFSLPLLFPSFPPRREYFNKSGHTSSGRKTLFL